MKFICTVSAALFVKCCSLEPRRIGKWHVTADIRNSILVSFFLLFYWQMCQMKFRFLKYTSPSKVIGGMAENTSRHILLWRNMKSNFKDTKKRWMKHPRTFKKSIFTRAQRTLASRISCPMSKVLYTGCSAASLLSFLLFRRLLGDSVTNSRLFPINHSCFG